MVLRHYYSIYKDRYFHFHLIISDIKRKFVILGYYHYDLSPDDRSKY